MSDPEKATTVAQVDLCFVESTTGRPPSVAMTNDDSELTIKGDRKHGQIEEKDFDIEHATTTAELEVIPELIDGPPYGWVIVFASLFTQMISMGTCNIYGVFQNYYLNNTFAGTTNTFQLAWVGSLAVMALDIFGPFAGSFCDYFGHRESSLIGTVIMALSLVAASFATEIWHLYLTQGVLYGLGASLTYFAGLSLPAQWFTRNRGFVTGIAISGGGIGGLWMSPVVSSLLNNKGLRWTMLALAIGHFVLLIPASLLFKTRLESGRARAKRISQFGYRKGEIVDKKSTKFIDFSIMKDIRFCMLFIAGIFVVSGYFTPFYFISSYAQQNGASVSTAALMVGLMNGASAAGRIIMGLVSDKIGPINALSVSTFAATATILLIWTFAKTNAVMFAFSILYGLCCGAYLSSTVSVSAAICGLNRLGSVAGILYAGMAIGSTIGSPISGTILDNIGQGTNYLGVIIWSGSVMFIGTMVLFALKYKTSKTLFVKV